MVRSNAAEYDVYRAADSTEVTGLTEQLLARLPTWFGIAEANAEYVRQAGHLPALVARAASERVGVLLWRRHFPEAAEIHLMAVDPTWHRRGVGTALVAALASHLRVDGCQWLQVKTLGAAHPDRGYVLTRAFYQSVGFHRLEETSDLWPDNPCLIMVKHLLAMPEPTPSDRSGRT